MRLVTLIVALLLVVIQYPLWLGKGGWMRTWELERQIEVRNQTNDGLHLRNVALDAEVRDLKNGTDAIEERARFELGMIREGEAFVQIIDTTAAPAAVPQAGPPAPPRSATAPSAAGHANRR